MKIFIKTIDERVSDYVTVSLIMDDDGMKYSISDSRTGETTEERKLDIEVPGMCRREIMRRFIPNVDGKAGTLPKYQTISLKLEEFICECWKCIIYQEPQLLPY